VAAASVPKHERAAALKIYKHFSHTTPFAAAENEQELAEIMRLKYPKACSNLEVGAEFFARMVEEVRQFQAWRIIGFGSFEEFCAQELGKTLAEVEDIVEGVRILGGDPTEAEAKKASRSARAASLVRAGTHTQAQAAREIGISREAVRQGCQVKPIKSKRLDRIRTPLVGLSLDPTRTAANIIRKMGGDYAGRLAQALEEVRHGR
jgi:hypothetical protein